MKIYQEIAKKYTPEEIAESFIFPYALSENEREAALEEFSKFRKQATDKLTQKEKTISQLLQLKFLIEDYVASDSFNYKILNGKGKEIQTDLSLHPGDIIMDELETRNIMKSVFVEQPGMKASHFSKLLHGKRNVSAATAIKLEQLLGIKAEYWLRVQVCYDLFMERNKQLSLA